MKIATANRIFDILIAHVGARESDREMFLVAQLNDLVTEYRCCGGLGFGGKFWRNNDKWYVSGYSEDVTPQREAAAERANDALMMLLAEVGEEEF